MFTIGNMFNNLSNGIGYNNNVTNTINIMNQLQQCQQNPGAILDILAQNGKINQQQYNELQQYKNNPQQIAYYLMNHGNADNINKAVQMANSQMNNNS